MPQRFNSIRAGGRFDWPSAHCKELHNLSLRDKAKLTTWICDQNRQGQRARLTLDLVAGVKTWRALDVSQRSDRLLQYISKLQDRLDFEVTFTFTGKGSSFTEGLQAQAESECISFSELEYLAMALRDGGLLKITGFEEDFITVNIAPAGHARLAELAVANETSTQAFVAMWFDASIRSAFDLGVEPAVAAAGYKAFRIDNKEHNNKIDDEIISEIRRSRFVVADMTCPPDKPRGGVYFEAGFAFGLNIPVFWSCRKDSEKEIHFDTRQFAHILWTNEEDLKNQLTKKIRAILGQGPLRSID
ncbi:MAG: hypothetical protein ABL901_13775 [Hyphomicrobiaceae bacterium]